MRALEPEVFDSVWTAIEPSIPIHEVHHPLGCHRLRAPDRECFKVMVVRLVTGCSWEDAERLCGNVVSDTTARARRDEWVAAGPYDLLAEEAITSYDRIVGLDLSEASLDGSQHKAPTGGEGTGKNPADRGKLGWKWSLISDRFGIPIGWATDGANRHDTVLFAPTLFEAKARGLLIEVETLHLDRGYDSAAIRALCAEEGLDDVVCQRVRHELKGVGKKRASTKTVPLGMRWSIERTNSWLSNFGQLRRCTDRKVAHRLAQLALAITFIIVAKLIDWRDRWSPIR